MENSSIHDNTDKYKLTIYLIVTRVSVIIFNVSYIYKIKHNNEIIICEIEVLLLN